MTTTVTRKEDEFWLTELNQDLALYDTCRNLWPPSGWFCVQLKKLQHLQNARAAQRFLRPEAYKISLKKRAISSNNAIQHPGRELILGVSYVVTMQVEPSGRMSDVMFTAWTRTPSDGDWIRNSITGNAESTAHVKRRCWRHRRFRSGRCWCRSTRRRILSSHWLLLQTSKQLIKYMFAFQLSLNIHYSIDVHTDHLWRSAINVSPSSVASGSRRST